MLVQELLVEAVLVGGDLIRPGRIQKTSAAPGRSTQPAAGHLAGHADAGRTPEHAQQQARQKQSTTSQSQI